jgi:hypothetical protein
MKMGAQADLPTRDEVDEFVSRCDEAKPGIVTLN